jgi:hypothetical protein
MIFFSRKIIYYSVELGVGSGAGVAVVTVVDSGCDPETDSVMTGSSVGVGSTTG